MPLGLRFSYVIPYGIQFFKFYISGASVLQKLYSRIVKNRVRVREDTQIDFFHTKRLLDAGGSFAVG